MEENSNGKNLIKTYAPWVLIIVAIIVFWPVGLLLLFLKIISVRKKQIEENEKKDKEN